MLYELLRYQHARLYTVHGQPHQTPRETQYVICSTSTYTCCGLRRHQTRPALVQSWRASRDQLSTGPYCAEPSMIGTRAICTGSLIFAKARVVHCWAGHEASQRGVITLESETFRDVSNLKNFDLVKQLLANPGPPRCALACQKPSSCNLSGFMH